MKMTENYIKEYGGVPLDNTSRIMSYLETHDLHRVKKSVLGEISRISRIRWKTISFVIYLVPKATPRPRSNYKNHVFYVNGSAENKRFFMKEIQRLDLDMIVTPMKFFARAYMPISKNMGVVDQILAEEGWIRPICVPDFDNLAKTYTDMMKSSLIYDDALIVDGRMEKYYSWKPRIEVQIEYMEEFDSEFNKNKIFKKERK